MLVRDAAWLISIEFVATSLECLVQRYVTWGLCSSYDRSSKCKTLGTLIVHYFKFIIKVGLSYFRKLWSILTVILGIQHTSANLVFQVVFLSYFSGLTEVVQVFDGLASIRASCALPCLQYVLLHECILVDNSQSALIDRFELELVWGIRI